MLLQNKTAVIYGAAGSLGTAISTAFALAGATVFVTGRDVNKVEKLAAQIRAGGGEAFAARVDAIDKAAVSEHLDTVFTQTGRVDISFNLIGLSVIQGMPLTEMTMEDFVRPVQIAMQAHFITATAAAKKMRTHKKGVILTLTATPGGIGYPMTAGFAPACAGIPGIGRGRFDHRGHHRRNGRHHGRTQLPEHALKQNNSRFKKFLIIFVHF